MKNPFFKGPLDTHLLNPRIYKFINFISLEVDINTKSTCLVKHSHIIYYKQNYDNANTINDRAYKLQLL